MENLEQELANIKERNKKVEMDKAWELSWTRRILICVLTYIIAFVWLLVIKEHNAAAKAVVPTAGFALSMLSIPYAKKLWIKNRKP